MKTLNHPPTSRSRQKGLTAIELIAILAVVGIIFVIALPRIQGIFGGTNEQTLQSDIAALVGGAKKWRGVRPNYSGINCAAIAGTEYANVGWTTCTGVNPAGGNYTLTAGSGNTLVVTATALEANFCERVRRSIEPTVVSATCSGGTLTTTHRG